MAKHGYSVIDAEPHILEPFDAFERYLPKRWHSHLRIVPDPQGWLESGFRYELQGKSVPRHSRLIERQSLRRVPSVPNLAAAATRGTPDVYLEGMNELGMDVGVFMPTAAMLLMRMDGLDPAFSAALCQASNDFAAAFCQYAPDRMRFWALLPPHDPERAAAEARRAVQELGALGVAMSGGAVSGNLYSDAYWEPLWHELSALGVPLGIHATTPTALGMRDIDVIQYRYRGHRRAEGFQHAPIFMFSAHTTAAEFIMGGVLEQFPQLRLVFMESGGGWLPHFLNVMDERWETYGPEMEFQLPIAPSAYFKRQCFAVVECEESLLPTTVSLLGDRNWVLSTDYPHHDCSFPDAVEEFLELPGLSDESRRRILWDNAAELFGLARPGATPVAQGAVTP